MGVSISGNSGWIKALKWVARVLSLPALIIMTGELLLEHSVSGVEEDFKVLFALGILIVATFSLALAWFRELAGGWVSLGGLILFLIVYWISVGEFFPAYWLLLVGIGAPAGLFLLYAYIKKPSTQ